MAFYFARIWLTDSAAKLVLIAAVLVAKISAANRIYVHQIKNRVGDRTGKGKNPFEYVLAHNGEKLSAYVDSYDSLRLSSQTVCDDIAEKLDGLIESAEKDKG